MNFCVDVARIPGESNDRPSMIILACASRELPFPTKYIVQPPKVVLLLALKVLTSPIPVNVAATTTVLVPPVGAHPCASQAKACSVMIVGDKAAADRSLASKVKAPWDTGPHPLSTMAPVTSLAEIAYVAISRQASVVASLARTVSELLVHCVAAACSTHSVFDAPATCVATLSRTGAAAAAVPPRAPKAKAVARIAITEFAAVFEPLAPCARLLLFLPSC